METQRGTAVYAALAANLGIAVAKFAGFLVTGASALLAESIHSVADSGNQVLLLVGRQRARRSADPARPFGYGAENFFFAFVVSLVLFSVGSGFSMYEGIHKLLNPAPIESPLVAVILLVVSAVLEGFSFRTALKESKEYRGGQGWMRFVRETKKPELAVVLMEDAAALVGLALALAGVGLTMLTGSPLWDSLATIAIALLLAAIAVVLSIETKSLLIGEAASYEDRRALAAAIEGSGCVRRLIHMRTLQLGPDEILVAAKVEMQLTLGFTEISEAVDAVEAAMRQAVPDAKLIYIEPAVFDAARKD